MELILKAKDIRVEFKGRDVLDINELEVYDYDRIGLVGANGAGKSTLLRVLLGELTPPGCKMNRLGELAYIPQLDEVTLQVEKDFALVGKLGVEQLDIQTMSGGEETRLKIAQALSAQVHGILADEPTSHLDREGIDFLIGQLKYFTGALLVISHDRYFLDEIVDKIWELKDGKITEYWGNYSDYLRQKEEERKSQAAEYEQFIAERARLERAAEEKRKQARKIEQKAKGASKKKSTEGGGRLAHQKSIGSKEKKMHNAAKSLEHRIAALGNVEAPEDIRRIRFRQSKALELHNPYPIVGTEITKIFGDKALFENASFQIPLGAKVALTGGNGTGKTTLIQMILNHEDGISISPKAKIGYFAQNGYKYNSNQKVLEFMQEDCDYNVSEIRSVLASMGFKQNDIGKSLSVLSGGEIMKLLLAKMLMGRYNILLMDEPSNFLDIPSLEALEILMKEYAGKECVRMIYNIIQSVTEKLSSLPYIEGIVLGGSRARGTHTEDSDIDIGIYYNQESFDLTAINQIATELDDENRNDLVVPPGAWGDWINGGGWLVINGYHVDLILRDIKRVEQIIKDTEQGIVTANYQTGHPHGYISAMYRGELAISKIQYAKNERLCELKNQAEIYPGALKKNLINFFIFEAEFSLMFVKANAGAEDKYYIAGHVFRIISCLNQVLFACNNAYCINEKKAIKLLETFEYKPEKYAERVNHIFEVLGLSLFECYDMTEKLYKEVKKIATEINNFLNEGNSDERKQI